MELKPMVHGKISFVIRTYNEDAFIGRLLDALGTQQGAPLEREVIVVDSGSTDATLEIARSHGATVLHIRKEDFDYSKALNRGIENASGEFIVILSAHSIPCDSRWLAAMLAHFQDPAVAGAYSRQVAWPDAQWWEQRRVRREFPATAAVYEKRNNPGAVPFSNAASCIRRTFWQKHPFSLPTGEDGEWATWAVDQGGKIVYDPGIAVYHSHHETCRQAMRRVIEFEKVSDLRLARSRTSWLTFRQALGRAFRDWREVWNLTNAPQPRSQLAWEALVRAFWFARDFRRDKQFRSPVRLDREDRSPAISVSEG